MAASDRLILFFSLALAACGGAAPDANQAQPAKADDPPTRQQAAPVPGNAANAAAPADLAASRIDFAALAGRWKVTGVVVGGGVQALIANDPAYMGQLLDIGPDRLAWANAGPDQKGATLSDRCDGPVTARQSGAAAQDYDRQFAAQLSDLKISHPDPHAVECDTGQWGPNAAGGAVLFPAGEGRIAMSWYDGAVLLIERQKPAG
ncbi:hypothetical protein MOK15_21350 [Sphingobium sp. BYY-5]|uniref:hypothetical protein n=1 Tax=Sphingobium sp. BYY-5 TaxID=2926400 RepID=UPI001FA7401E|nr:hypothetical protein [Sphingobium sp. BYY-5]MCI4592606.1 hypothetical protein [Sphingobium sp. BYY-5]